jgi:hypothetical protein
MVSPCPRFAFFLSTPLSCRRRFTVLTRCQESASERIAAYPFEVMVHAYTAEEESCSADVPAVVQALTISGFSDTRPTLADGI